VVVMLLASPLSFGPGIMDTCSKLLIGPILSVFRGGYTLLDLGGGGGTTRRKKRFCFNENIVSVGRRISTKLNSKIFHITIS
jgi:hypothetical protein